MNTSNPQSLKRQRGADDQKILEEARPHQSRKIRRGDDGFEDSALDVELHVNRNFAMMDGRLLADYVAQRIRRFASHLSLVEIEDQYLPEKAILDTSGWKEPRDLVHLSAYLQHYTFKDSSSLKLSAASKKKGSPHTIIVTSAGLRAADITRALRSFQSKDAIVAKLFAKHIKLNDAITYVKNTRISIGVGTPSRLIDLLNEGALSFEKLDRIVIDCSHIDQKKRGILDIRELQQPLMRLLNRDDLRERYGAISRRVELLFF